MAILKWYQPPPELPPYPILVCFYVRQLNGAPLLRKKGVWPSFMRGRKLAQTLHEFWLTQFLSVREGTHKELLHHEGIYNMHYFLACRTNVMSTLRLLKRVFCYTKLVFSLKWLGLSAGEISQLNTIAHISKNIRIRENGLIFPDTPR